MECGLLWRCGSVRGKRVLVIGATSGVGHFALQIASARGARVTAVCSEVHAERAIALGFAAAGADVSICARGRDGLSRVPGSA